MTMRCLRIGGSNGGLKVMDESGPLGLGSWVGGEGDDPLAGWALMRGEEVGSDAEDDSVDDGAVELGEWRSPRG